MAYTLGNKSTKNCCKQTVLVQLIIEDVVTIFFGTQCRYEWFLRCLSFPTINAQATLWISDKALYTSAQSTAWSQHSRFPSNDTLFIAQALVHQAQCAIPRFHSTNYMLNMTAVTSTGEVIGCFVLQNCEAHSSHTRCISIYSFVSVITRSTITSEKLKWFNTSNINNQNIKQLRKTGSKSMNIYNRNNHDRQPTTNISQTMCKLIILQNFKATQWNKKFLTPHSNHKFINFAKLGRLHSRS